jgi:periplasmic divalent cation tolerance protein
MPRIIVLSTCGSNEEARTIARDLLQRKLAACINIFPVSSCYRWKRKIVKGREWLMIIKTNSRIFPKVKQRILALNSYEVPEVVSLKMDAGSQPYLTWLDGELS